MPHNNTSLAGEFAVLSQLFLRGYDANLTLGNTKSVDILGSNPLSGKMFKLEVKTTIDKHNSDFRKDQRFGKFLCSWIMGEKHDSIKGPDLYYCFVQIKKRTGLFRYFIVPSKIVSEYTKKQHQLYVRDTGSSSTTRIRSFRVGFQGEKYKIPTPTIEKYENNWKLLG